MYKVDIRDWKHYVCKFCGLQFMVMQDQEHDKKNTNCPECRCSVKKKGED